MCRKFLEVQGAGFFQGGDAALEVNGVREAGGFQLAQGFVRADPGVADHQEALVFRDFAEAAAQGLRGDVEPAVAEKLDVGGGVGGAPA